MCSEFSLSPNKFTFFVFFFQGLGKERLPRKEEMANTIQALNRPNHQTQCFTQFKPLGIKRFVPRISILLKYICRIDHIGILSIGLELACNGG